MGGEENTFYKDILDQGRVSGEGTAENSRVDCSALQMFYLSVGLVQVTGGPGPPDEASWQTVVSQTGGWTFFGRGEEVRGGGFN